MKFKDYYKKIVVGFIAVLIVMTLSSRSIYYALTPKVEYENYISSELSDTITVKGEIIGKNTKLYYVDEELMVIEVGERSSENVEKGDLLFRLDVSPLENQLDNMVERLHELQIRINQYGDELKNNGYMSEECKIQLEDMRKEFNSKKELYEAGSISESDLKSYEESLNSKMRELERLEIKSKSESQGKLSTREIYNQEILRVEGNISDLKEKIELYSEFRADESGVIVYSDIEVGKVVRPNQILYKMAKPDSGYQFVSEIPDEYAKKLKIGDKIAIAKIENKDTLRGVVSSIINEDSKTNIKLDLEDGDYKYGEFAVFSLTNSLGKYEKTVPLSAIHNERGTYYIYVVRESESALGKTFIAERVQVEVIEESSEKVAFESDEIRSGDKIITSSSDFLSDRMKIVIKL